MKILYISPQHISGTLPLFCRGHHERGNPARYLTLFPSKFGFPEDLELKLPLFPNRGWISKGRYWLNRLKGITPEYEPPGKPSFRPADTGLEALFFKFRDELIQNRVYEFMQRHQLWDYDLYHLEQGTGIFRDCRELVKLQKMGKKFACFYHGNDVRNRGVIPEVHRISLLNLTSELDLLPKYPGIKHLFLPIDAEAIKPKTREHPEVKICHATRSRFNKGSDFILQTVKRLQERYPLEMILIENQPHNRCLELMADCDIYIDQIADRGGWGYGMSSVESLALGLATCTCMNPACLEFLPDHPFVNVNYDNLGEKIIKLVEDKGYREEASLRGREWVLKRHSLDAVMEQLYGYYKEAGII